MKITEHVLSVWTEPEEGFPFMLCELPDLGGGRRTKVKVIFERMAHGDPMEFGTKSHIKDVVRTARLLVSDVEEWLANAKKVLG